MEIRNSQEDYLEAILVISQSAPQVRGVDIAEHLGFSKASVSRAMGHLLQEGLISVDKGKHITLTPKGEHRAQNVYEKHRFFTQLFLDAGIEKKEASEEACRIEHAISDKAFQAIKAVLGKA